MLGSNFKKKKRGFVAKKLFYPFLKNFINDENYLQLAVM